MDKAAERPRLLRAIPPLVVAVLSLPRIGEGDWRVDIGWYSAIGLQAWRTGSLWTLWAEPGIAYFNKPPLVIWIHGLALWLAGPALWAARLPSIVAACVGVWGTGRIAERWAGPWAGFVAALVLATTPEFVRRAREVSMDLWMVAFLVLAGVWAIRGGWRGVVGAGVCIGCSLMCKPLVGLVGVPIVAAWMPGLTVRRWAVAGAGIAGIAAVVGAPWHVSMVTIHGDEFLRQYFGAEVAARAAGNLVDPERAGRDGWFYLGLLARTYWPWSAALVLCALRWKRLGGHRRALMLGGGWVIGWLVAVSVFQDRRPRYAMPVYPGLALVVGVAAGTMPAVWVGRLQRLAGPIVGHAIVIAIVFALFAPVRVHRPADPQWAALFDWLRANGVDRLWEGSLQGPRAARVYLELGWWPRATHDRWGERVGDPARGELILYHDRDGRAPGEGEVRVFESGRLAVTRLEADEWRPVAMADPGE